MKSKKSFFGILVLVLVFGMMVVGCDEGNNPDTPPTPQPGESANNPIEHIAETNLGLMTSSASGWRQLLNSIESTGKYINLDLSACTMTGTIFNPDATVETGKKYIVSIILPTVATEIGAGTFSSPTFRNFTNLKSINGENIITIGDYSFLRETSGDYSWSYLQSVDFPKTTTIGEYAFSYTRLETVTFPQVTTIGDSAFYSCYSLKNASFPVVQNIGVGAFSSCSYLESISFPASAELGLTSDSYSNPFTRCSKITFTLNGTGSLSTIENGKALVRNGTILLAYPSASGVISMDNITALDGKVFYGCGAITGINFPQVTSIGSEAFRNCSNYSGISIQDVSFPKAIIIGSYAFADCLSLQSASFPLVTTIDTYTFNNSRNLMTLNIPSVTRIERLAFYGTDNTELTITMGYNRPTLGSWIFGSSSEEKTVRVKVPAGATGYSPFAGSSVTVSGTNTTENWANGFRGGGWNGTAFAQYGAGYIRQNITLIIQQQ